MSHQPSRPRPLTDVSAAAWLVERTGGFASKVNSLLPSGFDSYARILHPAWPSGEALASGPDPGPVPWAVVAAAKGREMHPRVQFGALVGAERGEARDYEPDVGELRSSLLSALCDVLDEHTATPERCWYCLWDGWGWIEGSPSVGVIDTSEAASDAQLEVPPAFAPEILNGPRVSLSGRDYIFFEGPLSAASELGWRTGELLSLAYPKRDFDPEAFEPQSPNLFWPQDRAWCVATEVDLDSTYVGGSEALVEALLADPRFETMPAELHDRIDAGADEINA